MAINRAALVESANRGKRALDSKSNARLRLADARDQAESRLRRVADLISNISREVQILAREEAFAVEAPSISALAAAGSVDFYSEVERFEKALIKLALRLSDGNQARAARWLKLRPTTLNSKIKLYEIDA